MNILFISNEYPPCPHGGIGTVTQTLAEGLHARGHSIVVAGFYDNVSSSLSCTDEQGILIYRLRRFKRPFGHCRSRFRLYLLVRKLITSHSIDILEASDYLGLPAFWPQLPIPMVVRLHGSTTYLLIESGQKPSKKYYYFELMTLRKAALLIAVSKSIAEKTKRIFNITNPMEIIYNSINCDNKIFLNKENKDLYKVVFTGTLMKIKGVFSLIEAWPDVVNKIPQAKLHLFGKDSYNESGSSIKSLLLQKLPQYLHDTVVFYGHVSRQHILKELGTAAVAVFPSFTEAFALAPLEAMAQGCPTIYTKLASGPEVIDDGVNGLLVDPAKPFDIAKTIIAVLTDKHFAAVIGDEGRRSVTNRFSNDTILLQNEEMYRKVLARH